MTPADGATAGPSGSASPPVNDQFSGYAIRSLGKPYFAMRQNDSSGMNYWGGGEEVILTITFALHAMPTQNQSPDEEHVLVALVNRAVVGGADYLHIGVTPNGSVFGQCHPNARAATAAGCVAADNKFYTATLTTERGGVTWIECNGQTSGFLGQNIGYDLSPSRFFEWMLFNGASGLTRCDCTISSVQYQDGNGIVTWNFHEGSGYFTQGGPTPQPGGELGDSYVIQNFTQTATFYDPLINGQSWPWGSPPHNDSGIASAFRWTLNGAWAPGGGPPGGWAPGAAPPGTWNPDAPPHGNWQPRPGGTGGWTPRSGPGGGPWDGRP